LIGALGDTNAGVRVSAADALGALRPRAKVAVENLVYRAGKDDNEQVRKAFGNALKKIDPAKAAELGIK
jgi:HEAT repeat protein